MSHWFPFVAAVSAAPLAGAEAAGVVVIVVVVVVVIAPVVDMVLLLLLLMLNLESHADKDFSHAVPKPFDRTRHSPPTSQSLGDHA